MLPPSCPGTMHSLIGDRLLEYIATAPNQKYDSFTSTDKNAKQALLKNGNVWFSLKIPSWQRMQLDYMRTKPSIAQNTL